MSDSKPIRRVAIIGTGAIGASWAALFLAKGLEVIATDIAPDAETALRRFVNTAWPALERLGLAPGASQSRLKFTTDLPAAVRAADLVQENGPERIDFKKRLYRQLDELLSADVILASSSSGLTMSEFNRIAPITRSAVSSAIRLIRRTWFRSSRSLAARRHRKRLFCAPLNSTRAWESRPSGYARKCLGTWPIAYRLR